MSASDDLQHPIGGGRPRHGEIKRRAPMTAPLLEPDAATTRRSASHGEAGYARNARDAYFTEPWVTRALLAAFPSDHFGSPIWEPACGDGRMAEVLYAHGFCVFCSDIHDYGYQTTTILDFLRDPAPPNPSRGFDAVITNPPFDLAKQFIAHGLEVTKPTSGKVAILQRHEFDAPKSNHHLFQPPLPFAAKLILHKRPRWSTEDKASPRFPYAWFLWDWKHEGPPVLRYLPDPDAAPVGRFL